jgi:hypothetical protein
MKTISMTLIIAIIFIISTRGQGFQNLNFESAQNLPGNPGLGGEPLSAADALPDWTAYSGPNILANIFYVSNSFPGVSTVVELEGGSLALSGNNLSVGLYNDGSISQTGLVPENAESLQFEANITDNALLVTLGGQSLSYSALSEAPDYTVYGANIPADMDGQMEALTFLVQGLSAGTLLDDIEFSAMSIPEPSEYVLVGLGAMLFGLRRFRKGFSGQASVRHCL